MADDFVIGKIEFATVTSGHLPSVAMPSGGFTVVPSKPEPSVPLSAIRSLEKRWREQAEHLRQRDVDDDDLGIATGMDRCANELAALCPAPPESGYAEIIKENGTLPPCGKSE